MSDSRLHQWLQQQLAAGLPALAGTRVTASVPMQVGLVNELIAEALAEVAPTAPPASAGSSPGVAPLLRHIRSVKVDASPGVITLDVTVSIDG